MNEKTLNIEERERLFLAECGFFFKFGYWQEDLDSYRAKNPYKYHYFVICGETKPLYFP